jgi:hypothetical protein
MCNAGGLLWQAACQRSSEERTAQRVSPVRAADMHQISQAASAGKYHTAWAEREARRLYSAFVRQGVSAGRRPELVGGGPLRSLGGISGSEGFAREKGSR